MIYTKEGGVEKWEREREYRIVVLTWTFGIVVLGKHGVAANSLAFNQSCLQTLHSLYLSVRLSLSLSEEKDEDEEEERLRNPTKLKTDSHLISIY